MTRGARKVLVVGPPCSGKSSYVAERRRPGDLVIDFDAIAVALGSPDSHDHPASLRPFAGFVVEALLDRLSRVHDVTTVWWVRCDPTPVPGWEVVTMGTDWAECHARADAAGRPALWHALIDRAFAGTLGSS
jgi:hypothetical protein